MMEGKVIIESEEEFELHMQKVAVAINGDRKSKYVVKWALDKFIPEGVQTFKLLHVRPRITSVPTPMGNFIPISQVRDDVAEAYRKEVEWQASELLIPSRKMFAQKKVKVDVVMVESDDVANALAEEVAKSTINKLVIGASSVGMFTRKKGKTLSSRISESTPSFCTIYVVSKGKLSSVRPSDTESKASVKDDSSDTCSTKSSSSFTSSSQAGSVGSSYSHFRTPSLPMQRFQALSGINQNVLTRTHSNATNHSSHPSIDIEKDDTVINSYPRNSDIGYALSHLSSSRSVLTDNRSWVSDPASTSDQQTDAFSMESQVNVDFELEKLRNELRRVQGMYQMAQSETVDASKKLNILNKLQSEEADKLKEVNLKEEKARELARQEKDKYEAAKCEADYIRERVKKEALLRKEAEAKTLLDAKAKEMLENAPVDPIDKYQKFTWEEIISATSSFSDSLKIGMGSYGAVYKCSLHHTTAAVKVLHTKDSHNTKQFQQEIKILSEIRHPHLLLLLGACPDRGCIVYEYMENGSLQDRLLRKDNTPPIPWFDRYRIAFEIASALVFLHKSKPKPIIHRDLKPANILLDHNFVSKIGDVGLSTMLQTGPTSMSTVYKDTGPVGTLCYIDPEYQRTGQISAKSDVYAFGMVILQLLTAKHPQALIHVVEMAIEDDCLVKILDSEAGKWPIEETKELAILGLKCTELRGQERPDLKNQVLPVLERLQDVADRGCDSFSSAKLAPPNHFICPILQDIMSDPYVAADGYTYDRKAIEIWLEDNDKSPMTNLPLPNKNLLPNYTLLSAIKEWRSSNNK